MQLCEYWRQANFLKIRWTGLFIGLWSLILCYSIKGEAFPEALTKAPKIAAVEPRLYNPRYDVTGYFSSLPIDAFYKGWALGVAYTHGWSAAWSWEVVNAQFNSKQDTGLRQDLIQNFGVAPKGILDHVSTFAASNFVYTPIYAKNLLFNESILHSHVSFVFGGGIVSFSSGQTAPMFGGGLIYRVFHNPKYSSKFDFRLYAHTAAGKSSDMIMLVSYGLAYDFGDNRPWE